MSALTADRFDEFYFEASRAIAQLQRLKVPPETIGLSHPKGRSPFPWQSRMAARVCDPSRIWPDAIALPTAAGKTACIDIAVFSLAVQARLGDQRMAPRRILFVVDRRIVVDQAYEHAKALSEVLRDSKAGILKDVADALLQLAMGERPLDAYALRGGMYRDTAWTRSPLQPTVIASTVDQVGSRLLFRGYGVTDSMKPVHAGLIGNDALILLDEAHCAKPFEQTVQYVKKYREWGDGPKPPFQFVSITATPITKGEIERDTDDDRKHAVLGPRLAAAKPAALVVAQKAKGKTWKNWGPPLVRELAEQARSLLAEDLQQVSDGTVCTNQAIGVIVNRVATARALATELRQAWGKESEIPDVVLLTGRMRPIDRDAVLERIQPLMSGSDVGLKKPTIVVATQCLEVGADLDFHALVTECASLDALRQRFGRLNRVAARPLAKAVIVIRADQTEDTAEDPVYGSSLSNTWKWLQSKASEAVVDFGVSAIREATEGEDLSELNAPSLDAPVLFPAHLDCWVQTHPIPMPDPDPAVFLHGPQSGPADVQVIFREDLGDDTSLWTRIVSLCPPSSAEAAPVQIGVLRKWLSENDEPDLSSDLEGDKSPDQEQPTSTVRLLLRWKGPDQSELIDDPSAIHPGDTLIVRIDPSRNNSLQQLCDFPAGPDGEISISDCGDEAFVRSRDRAICRLPDLKLAGDEEDFDEQLSAAISSQLSSDAPDWKREIIQSLLAKRDRTVVCHPWKGWVVTGKSRLHRTSSELGSLEDAESSESPSQSPILLDSHCHGVAEIARQFAEGCGLDGEVYATAGLFHDIGKLDPRFQAMLRGRSPRTAVGTPLAKSAGFNSVDSSVHRYPSGGRHELLSAALMATLTDNDLLLHLIATHHGSARPFAKWVEENESAPSPFIVSWFGEELSAETSAQSILNWNPTLAERFWRVVRRFGWWGSAFREAVLRLADHEQSRREQDGAKVSSDGASHRHLTAPLQTEGPTTVVALPGLDGANPLAFLAAIGLLRALSEFRTGYRLPRLAWESNGSRTIAQLYLNSPDPIEDLLPRIVEQAREATGHLQFQFAQDLSVSHSLFRKFCLDAASLATALDHSVADYAVAFGSELSLDEAEVITDTSFRTMAGAGHQHFIGFMTNILGKTEVPHLSKALFSPWIYDDPVESLTMRWDPIDDVRYAVRWRNPSGDPVRKRRGSMLGANCLAIMALPLFPTVCSPNGIMTTGFRGRRASNTFFTWPIWSRPLTIDSIRSLLSLANLQLDCPRSSVFEAVGIEEVFRAQRLTIGKVRNFSPATAVATVR